MITQKMMITNAEGLHMRPAGVFAKEMGAFQCRVTIVFDGKRINGKSLLNIISACIKCGSEISIECDGSDEQQAIAKAIQLIESNFVSS